jgi:imidazoleglycerol phosphate dehydratase HisB
MDRIHQVNTGVGFLDRMLTHLAVHGVRPDRQAQGDLHIDVPHRTLPALGQALDQALGEWACPPARAMPWTRARLSP